MSQKLIIWIKSGAQSGRKYSLEEEGDFLLGRSPSCDICLPDNSVSGTHAILRCDGRQWFVVDQSSRNGSILNGVRLNPVPVPLPPEGTLALANVQLQFRIEGLSVQTPLPRNLDAAGRPMQPPPSGGATGSPVPPPASTTGFGMAGPAATGQARPVATTGQPPAASVPPPATQLQVPVSGGPSRASTTGLQPNLASTTAKSGGTSPQLPTVNPSPPNPSVTGASGLNPPVAARSARGEIVATERTLADTPIPGRPTTDRLTPDGPAAEAPRPDPRATARSAPPEPVSLFGPSVRPEGGGSTPRATVAPSGQPTQPFGITNRFDSAPPSGPVLPPPPASSSGVQSVWGAPPLGLKSEPAPDPTNAATAPSTYDSGIQGWNSGISALPKSTPTPPPVPVQSLMGFGAEPAFEAPPAPEGFGAFELPAAAGGFESPASDWSPSSALAPFTGWEPPASPELETAALESRSLATGAGAVPSGAASGHFDLPAPPIFESTAAPARADAFASSRMAQEESTRPSGHFALTPRTTALDTSTRGAQDGVVVEIEDEPDQPPTPLWGAWSEVSSEGTPASLTVPAETYRPEATPAASDRTPSAPEPTRTVAGLDPGLQFAAVDARELTALQEQLQAREQANLQLQTDLKRAQQELKALQSEHQKAQAEVQRLQAEQQKARGEVQREVQRLVAEQQKAQSEAQRLLNEQQQTQGEVQRLQAEHPRALAEIQRLQSELQRAVAEIQRLQGEMQRALAEIKRLQTELQRGQGAFQQGQGELQRLSQENAILKQQLLEHQKELEMSRSRLATTQNALQELEGQLRGAGRTGPDPTANTMFRQAIAFSETFGQTLEALAATLAAGTDPARARTLVRDISLQLGDMRSLLEEGRRISSGR